MRLGLPMKDEAEEVVRGDPHLIHLPVIPNRHLPGLARHAKMLEKDWLFNVTHVTTVPHVCFKTDPELIDEDLVLVISLHHSVFLVPVELAARYAPLLG